MTVRTDGMGNLIGHYPAQNENAPVSLFGSHLDTVRDAGKYDGVLGFLLALAVVENLGGRRLPFAVDVIGFSEEEGVRFGVPYLGSLAVTGQLTPALLNLTDDADVTVTEAIQNFGLIPPAVGHAAYAPSCLLGYVETHIEQGPVLDELGLPLGIVSAIAGQTRVRVALTGRAGHAGTTPMALRRDALAGAAEFVLAAERRAQATLGLVATVGQIEAWPGASNVIPGTAMLSLDVRHAEDGVREAAVRELETEFTGIGRRRGLDCHWVEAACQPAAPMEAGLSDALAQSVAASGVPVHWMTSGAGHDAAVLAGFTPSAMLFLRSPGGVSHHPSETVRGEDVAVALSVLSDFLRRMAGTVRQEP